VRRFYLATRKDRTAEATAVAQALEAQGWERTLDWSTLDDQADSYAEIALAELTAVRAADLLIVLLPGGLGTHVEIGAALALGKPVIIHARDQVVLHTPYPCVFHYHPNVKLLVSEDLEVGALISIIP
jgi:nucleoside 2-deoxyribosyltransferase